MSSRDAPVRPDGYSFQIRSGENWQQELIRYLLDLKGYLDEWHEYLQKRPEKLDIKRIRELKDELIQLESNLELIIDAAGPKLSKLLIPKLKRLFGKQTSQLIPLLSVAIRDLAAYGSIHDRFGSEFKGPVPQEIAGQERELKDQLETIYRSLKPVRKKLAGLTAGIQPVSERQGLGDQPADSLPEGERRIREAGDASQAS